MGILDRLFRAKPAKDPPAAEVYDGDGYEEDDDDGEAISVWDAADIYFGSGWDEDRMFGYSHDELVEAHESGG